MTDFQQRVLKYYDEYGRDLPWRQLADTVELRIYQVVVSEMMLQQTQVPRVLQKYDQWMLRFPTLKIASEATLQDILEVWQGLGYARRARYLHEICRNLAVRSGLPSSVEELTAFTGIGENTAGAILVYVFNQPHVFIETNIRTVFLAEFFEGIAAVQDAEIMHKVQKTLYHKNPRIWYWALMDYGTFLKRQGFNNNASASYVRQSPFNGSNRQLRGSILKHVVLVKRLKRKVILQLWDDPRAEQCLDELIRDQLLNQSGGYVSVADVMV